MDFKRLNDKQIEAIKHIDGPMLVLAGAGSGKTSVLTNRVAYLIESGVLPSNILAITFTNKAAREMKERILKLIGASSYQIQISTFHSLGLKILRSHYEKLGYDKNFVIIDSDDSLTIIKKIMKELNLDPKYYNAKNIRSKISSARNELLSVSEYKKQEFDNNIIRIYSRYLEKLKLSNSIDFDDLLVLPIELFKRYPNVLAEYQEQYKYVLIDEYQDTNEAQYVFSKMLSSKYRNLFVVGDADQSIYAFRGANFKNILNFEKDYPNTKTILLEQNYRSTRTILEAANSVIKNNIERKDKQLWSENEVGEKIKYIKTNNEKEEADTVIKKIEELINSGEKKEEIAILYRTNAQSRVMEEALLKKNIPYRIVGSFYFYNRKEIKDLISYLRLIYNHKDDTSLLRVINTPKRKIGEVTIKKLVEKAQNLGMSLYDVIDSGKELEFKKLIDEMTNLSKDLSLTEIVEMVLVKSGMKEELLKEKTIDSEIRLENLEEFKSITKGFEEEYNIMTLDSFLEEITLVSDVSEHVDESEKVTLMTVHAVKGLEFDNVFLIGMEEGIFPHINALMNGSSSDVEEERRLCYVAITRARKRLYILNAKRRLLFGKEGSNIPSRFIEEIDREYLEKESNNAFDIKNTINKFINKKNNYNEEYPDFSVGTMVKHDKFGEGIVTKVDKSILTIAFPYPHGTKTLAKNHKSISKV